MKTLENTRAGMLTVLLTLALAPVAIANNGNAEKEPFGAAVIIIELTDEDIELQLFADAFDWKRLRVFDPRGRLAFVARARGRLTRQGGLSEMVWASEPSHFLEEEDEYDESVEEFLARWPEGDYRFEGQRWGGLGALAGTAYLSHVLAALPQITSPAEDATVPHDEPLRIEWRAVDASFFDDGGPVEVAEYQVIVAQEEPGRETPWIDGDSRSALINLPASVCEFDTCGITIAAEILQPGAEYEIEILAIEKSGNASIGVRAFETAE